MSYPLAAVLLIISAFALLIIDAALDEKLSDEN